VGVEATVLMMVVMIIIIIMMLMRDVHKCIYIYYTLMLAIIRTHIPLYIVDKTPLCMEVPLSSASSRYGIMTVVFCAFGIGGADGSGGPRKNVTGSPGTAGPQSLIVSSGYEQM
jgi:hypothetical protein